MRFGSTPGLASTARRTAAMSLCSPAAQTKPAPGGSASRLPRTRANRASNCACVLSSQPVPVKARGHHHAAARPGNPHPLAHGGAGGPVGGGACVVQGDFDVQLARCCVKARRGVVAQRGARAVEHGAAVLQRGQGGAVLPGRRKDELEVVVKPGAHKPRQLRAGQGQPHKAGADLGAAHHLEVAALQGVANALDGEGGGRGGQGQRCFHGVKC